MVRGGRCLGAGCLSKQADHDGRRFRPQRWLVKVLETPEIRDQLYTHGVEPKPGTSEALAKHIESELALWGRVVKEAGIQAE